MNLHYLSRCTGFPCAALRAFAVHGILPVELLTESQNTRLFNGETFLRLLVELENGR
jgi:hypothetical protein